MADLKKIEEILVAESRKNFSRYYDYTAAIEATKTGRLFFPNGHGGKAILVVGLEKLDDKIAEAFLIKATKPKASANYALLQLDGVRGEIRTNAKGTCWVIDLASPRGNVIFAWESHHDAPVRDLVSVARKYAGPRLPASNNPFGPHHVGLAAEGMPFDKTANPNTVDFLERAVAFQKQNGKTPRQVRE